MSTEQYNPPLERKRVRTGSISGRLRYVLQLLFVNVVCRAFGLTKFGLLLYRTASDLEEIGMIDRTQKGFIKDMIISGDASFQTILEKYERGDKKELEGILLTSFIIMNDVFYNTHFIFNISTDLIRSGGLNRRSQSLDILDDLDFDFLNGMKSDLDVADPFSDEFNFDFSADIPASAHQAHAAGVNGFAQQQQHPSHQNAPHGAASSHVPASSGNIVHHSKPRTASTDSMSNFSFFDKDYENGGGGTSNLLDELHYLNRQYTNEESSFPSHYSGASGQAVRGAQGQYNNNSAGNNNYNNGRSMSSGSAHSSGPGGSGGGGNSPHVSFSRYISSVDQHDMTLMNNAGGSGGAGAGVGLGGATQAYGFGQQGGGGASTLSGNKGRRDSWDITAQYIQQEEDYARNSRNNRGSGGAYSGQNQQQFDGSNSLNMGWAGAGLPPPSQQQGQGQGMQAKNASSSSSGTSKINNSGGSGTVGKGNMSSKKEKVCYCSFFSRSFFFLYFLYFSSNHWRYINV
jgi:hypothetical protein